MKRVKIYIGRLFLIVIGAIPVATVGWIVWVLYAPPQLLYFSSIRTVEEAIREIEKYKSQYGYYPNRSQFRPPPDWDGNMFYGFVNNGYVIGFEVGFDNEYTYDSRVKKWSFEPGGIPFSVGDFRVQLDVSDTGE